MRGNTTSGPAGRSIAGAADAVPEAARRPWSGKLDPRFLKFLVVGALNTAFGYTVFAGLIAIRFPQALALALSTTAGVLFNFKTTGGLVFGNGNNRLIVRFVAVYALLYGINLGALHGIESVGIGVYVASAALLLPMAVLAFLLNRTYVFGGKR